MVGMIATTMRHGLEDRFEVVGEGPFTLLDTSLERCCSCVRAVAGYSNTDVMTPATWPATVVRHLFLRWSSGASCV